MRRGALAIVAALLAAVGCATTGQQRPAEEVLATGGELGAAFPPTTVVVDDDSVSAWGVTEVADGSRLQLAYSGADAIARAELLKTVRVRITSVLVDVSNSHAQRQLVAVTMESVSGTFDRAGPLPHGWARVRRGDDVVLRVWAKLRVPRAALTAALQAPVADAGGDPSAVIDSLSMTEMRAKAGTQ
jgi:hypothetical protein